MRTLIDKFPEGYEGWAKAQGEEVVHRVIPPTKIVSSKIPRADIGPTVTEQDHDPIEQPEGTPYQRG